MRNRKDIALLALGALNAQEAAALREHLGVCENCRQYSEEMSRLAATLAFPQPESSVQASEMFHRRVAEKVEAAGRNWDMENTAVWFRGSVLRWRVVVPAIAVLLIAAFAFFASRNKPAVSSPELPGTSFAFVSGSETELAPTLANYQMVANQSLDKLDQLLTRQGNKSLPPAAVYTASGVTF